jgi:hypothetical protein
MFAAPRAANEDATMEDLRPFVTAAAVSTIMRSPRVYWLLKTISEQTFDDIVMSVKICREGCCTILDGDDGRDLCNAFLRELRGATGVRPTGFITCKEAADQPPGFVPYIDTVVDDVSVFAFAHKSSGRFFIVAADDASQLNNAMQIITAFGNVHSFVGVCSYCGRPGAFRQCSAQCNAASYCGDNCQRSHWDAHKTVCVGAFAPPARNSVLQRAVARFSRSLALKSE